MGFRQVGRLVLNSCLVELLMGNFSQQEDAIREPLPLEFLPAAVTAIGEREK